MEVEVEVARGESEFVAGPRLERRSEWCMLRFEKRLLAEEEDLDDGAGRIWAGGEGLED